MRVLELFGGYGSQALALENLGVDFTSDLCEIDKYAIQAYNQLHGETKNWGDICKIDETKLPYYDLITYSSPCQDFSVAGKQAGGEKGSGTRSSLLWECERIIRAVKPKYLLMENVKALTSKKFMPLFANWLRTLEDMGYQNWWKVLNAKDYGVPQNRERVFVVSILGGGYYQFPQPIPLKKRLKDVLEQNVDEKYYINKMIDFPQKDISDTIRTGGRGSQDIKHTWDIIKEPLACASRGRNPDNPSDRTTGIPTEQRIEINQNGTTNTITTVQKDNYVIEPKVMQVGNIVKTDSFGGNPQRGRIYSPNGCSPALNTCQGGGLEPKIVDDTYKNRPPREHEDHCPTIRSERSGLKVQEYGLGQKITEMYNPYNKTEIKDIAPTQLTNCGITTSSSTVLMKYDNCRIRKLTPRECWRLMGVKDEQFDKLHDISNSQLYKMAGNSIVVDVLMGIFKNIFEPTEQKGQMNLL